MPNPSDEAKSIVSLETADEYMYKRPPEEIEPLLNQMAKQDKPFEFIKSPEDLRVFITLIPKPSRPVFFEHFNNERILATVGNESDTAKALKTVSKNLFNASPVKRKDFLDFLDIHKLASISRNIDELVNTINQLPPAMQEGTLGLHSIKELEATELRALYDGFLSTFEKYLSDEKMTQLVESFDVKQLVNMATQYNTTFFIIAKYLPDAKFNTFMNGVVNPASSAKSGESFIDSLSMSSDLDKELSKLPREKSQLLADRVFATVRTKLLTSETTRYEQLLNQIGKHLSPEVAEVHKDLIVRNRASEEMIKHVFIFKQTLIDQQKYLLGKRDNKDDNNPKTVYNNKDTSINKKSNIIDEIIKRIDAFILRPETSEYKRLAEDMEKTYIPKMGEVPKTGFFSKRSGKASGTQAELLKFSDEATKNIEKDSPKDTSLHRP
jgi:hypothetical protein